jgi:hypothetical protein
LVEATVVSVTVLMAMNALLSEKNEKGEFQ